MPPIPYRPDTRQLKKVDKKGTNSPTPINNVALYPHVRHYESLCGHAHKENMTPGNQEMCRFPPGGGGEAWLPNGEYHMRALNCVTIDGQGSMQSLFNGGQIRTSTEGEMGDRAKGAMSSHSQDGDNTSSGDKSSAEVTPGSKAMVVGGTFSVAAGTAQFKSPGGIIMESVASAVSMTGATSAQVSSPQGSLELSGQAVTAESGSGSISFKAGVEFSCQAPGNFYVKGGQVFINCSGNYAPKEPKVVSEAAKKPATAADLSSPKPAIAGLPGGPTLTSSSNLTS